MRKASLAVAVLIVSSTVAVSLAPAEAKDGRNGALAAGAAVGLVGGAIGALVGAFGPLLGVGIFVGFVGGTVAVIVRFRDL